MAGTGKRLGKEVGGVFDRWNVHNIDVSFLDTFVYIMVSNIVVFGSRMSFGVLSKGLCRGVVNTDDCGEGLR